MIDRTVVPGDVDIRSALHSALLERHGEDAAIIDELGLCCGRVRVDVAVVNGTLHGYEIKSDRDSLRRLSGQVEFYGKVLDKATLVVGQRHLAKALEMVPSWWGVLEIKDCSSRLGFHTLRRGRKNPCRDPRSLVELLWRDAALAMLERRGIARGVRSKPRRVVWDRVCKHFAEQEIADKVHSHLKSRVEHQDREQPL